MSGLCGFLLILTHTSTVMMAVVKSAIVMAITPTGIATTNRRGLFSLPLVGTVGIAV